MKTIATLLVVLALATTGAMAESIYFGEDLGQGESIRLASHPNADAARAAFLGQLIGVGTETFESFAAGTAAPLSLVFPGAGTATLTGSGYVETVASGTNGFGRYPISGNNYWETGDVLGVTFSDPVAAFGFYGVDIGDFGGHVTLTLTDGTTRTYTMNSTTNGAGGAVTYWGIIDTENPFVGIQFGNTAAGVDYFGFDDMTIGSKEEVRPVPEPATLWLVGTFLSGLALRARRQRK